MGWRYFVITVGGLTLLMFLVRFLLFKIYESPKYLMSKGRDEDAVRVVHKVAKKNGKTSTLTLEDLKACEPDGYVARTDAGAALKRNLEKVNFSNIRALFITKKLGLSTSLIMAVWGLIGLGYPLYNAFIPYIQATRGADFGDGSTYLTYRNSLIIAVLGVPGALLGGWLVELPRMGRKGTLSLSTVLTGVFLYCSTTSLSSASLLGWQCAFNFFSNIMYAVLYGFTPELFPTPQRGTGNALAASCNRVFGIMAVSFPARYRYHMHFTDKFSPSLPSLQTSRPRHRSTPAALSSSLPDCWCSSCLSNPEERLHYNGGFRDTPKQLGSFSLFCTNS